MKFGCGACGTLKDLAGRLHCRYDRFERFAMMREDRPRSARKLARDALLCDWAEARGSVRSPKTATRPQYKRSFSSHVRGALFALNGPAATASTTRFITSSANAREAEYANSLSTLKARFDLQSDT